VKRRGPDQVRLTKVQAACAGLWTSVDAACARRSRAPAGALASGTGRTGPESPAGAGKRIAQEKSPAEAGLLAQKKSPAEAGLLAQKKSPAEAGLFEVLRVDLRRLDGVSLQALLAAGHGERDLLAFLQALEALGLDGTEMDEDVLAILTADETEALGIVEPLDGTHFTIGHD
jgi:hypothetical protein